MAEQFANLVRTTLTNVAGISAGASSLTVASALGFPSQGTFRVNIDNEIIIVGAISGTTLSSLTRGAETSLGNSTAAAAHNQGATVTLVTTAGAIAQLKADVLSWQRVTASSFTMPIAATQTGVTYRIKNYSGNALPINALNGTDTFDMQAGPLIIGANASIDLTDDTGLAGNWALG